MPLPNLADGQRRPGHMRSRALARTPDGACRPGQGPQPPDRRGLVLGFQGLSKGHELPKGQEGHPCGYEATERRHPAIDGRHQPVQQQTQAQPAPADPPQEEPKHDDAAQHKRPCPSPGPGGAVGCLPWTPCQGVYPMRPFRPGPRTARQALGHASLRALPRITLGRGGVSPGPCAGARQGVRQPWVLLAQRHQWMGAAARVPGVAAEARRPLFCRRPRPRGPGHPILPKTDYTDSKDPRCKQRGF